MSGPQRDEKDSVEAMVDVAVMLIQHVLEKCLAEEALVVGEVVVSLEEVGWKSPLEGWQGVLLSLLAGLRVRDPSLQSDETTWTLTWRGCGSLGSHARAERSAGDQGPQSFRLQVSSLSQQRKHFADVLSLHLRP